MFGLAVIVSSILFLSYAIRIKCNVRTFQWYEEDEVKREEQGFTLSQPLSYSQVREKCEGEELEDEGHSQASGTVSDPNPGADQKPLVSDADPDKGSHTNKNYSQILPTPTPLPLKGYQGAKDQQPLALAQVPIKNESEKVIPELDGEAGEISDFNHDECSQYCSVPRFKDCGGFGIGTGLLQVFLAVFYIFHKSKVRLFASLNILLNHTYLT